MTEDAAEDVVEDAAEEAAEDVIQKRLCLACKGKKYIYDYKKNQYTRNPCRACDEDGYLPFESHEDGYGPFRFVQHRLTTEIFRGESQVPLVTTTDVRNLLIGAEDEIVTRFVTGGIFSVDELLAICSLLKRLKAIGGAKINCPCCHGTKFTLDGNKVFESA